MFLTNNSSKSVDKYIEKLASFGIETTEEDFFTSTNATIVYLKEKSYKRIYALGTKSFKEQLKNAIMTENYEQAAVIRDEIKKREAK